jgi:uncharacterized protein YqfA (UPF0365 family)
MLASGLAANLAQVTDGPPAWGAWGWVFLAVAVLVVLLALMRIGRIFGLWVQALFAGAKFTLRELIGMRLRRVDARQIVLARIHAMRAGLDIPTASLESHYLAGGHVVRVVVAMIAADRAGIPLTWQTATAIDLAGGDVMDAAQPGADPRAIDGPSPADGKVVASGGTNVIVRQVAPESAGPQAEGPRSGEV